MANDEFDPIRISELDSVSEIDKESDYLVVVQPSDVNISGFETFKVTPQQLLSGSGVTYTAGDHIDISSQNVISATYENATTSADGLMSSTDKTKLNGIEAGANNYTLPKASTSILGGVKAGSGVTITSDGTISATGSGGATSLEDLDDVTLTAPTNGQVLQYNSTNSKWQNSVIHYSDIANTPNLAAVATSGDYTDLSNTPTIPDALSDLTSDVNISNPSNNDVLKYDSTSHKWVNGTGGGGGASALSALSDVTLTTPTNGQVLKYNGTAWVNNTDDDTKYTAGINVSISNQNVISATDTTYTAATTSADGLMSSSDKTKLDGIESGANAYTLPKASASTLGGIKVGTNLTIDANGVLSASGGGGTPWVEVTGTLLAGETSIILQDSSITANSTIDVYTTADIDYVSISTAIGSVTITFDAQSSNLGVKVRVS